MKNLLRTSATNQVSLILRIGAGVPFFAHGLQKIGFFGGSLEGTQGFLGGTIGLPSFVVWLVILAETLGSLALILGLLTRFCAACLILVMLGAITLVHAKNGFFMPGGFEFHWLMIGSLLPLVLKGGGMWSIDSLIAKKN